MQCAGSGSSEFALASCSCYQKFSIASALGVKSVVLLDVSTYRMFGKKQLWCYQGVFWVICWRMVARTLVIEEQSNLVSHKYEGCGLRNFVTEIQLDCRPITDQVVGGPSTWQNPTLMQSLNELQMMIPECWCLKLWMWECAKIS